MTERRPLPSAADVFAGPIRGELLGADRLAERARGLARAQISIHERRRRPVRERPARLLIRLAETRRILESSYSRLSEAASGGTDVGPAGEWLLDNFHVIREHVSHVNESLPVDYFRELPLLTEGALAEYPRVYEIAITLISHTEGRVDPENVDQFVGAFQEIIPLSLGELWAIPAMLRLGLLESVRRMTLRTVQRLDGMESADRWTARILEEEAAGDTAQLQALVDLVAEPKALTPLFVSRLLQQLRASTGTVPSLGAIEQWFAEEGIVPSAAAAQAAQRLALTTHVMSNSIMSLRSISPRDWRAFVENQSSTEKMLRGDPAGAYARMTFATRDTYRHAVERIAKGSTIDEVEVARRAVEMAAQTPDDPRRSHVGYWLVDRGVVEFEQSIGCVVPVALRFHRWMLRHPNLIYVGGIVAGTLAALGPVYAFAGPEARTELMALILISLMPAFDIATSVMSQLVTAYLPPHQVPKLEFVKGGIPEDCRTAVVVPTLFASVEGVLEALSNLEVQFLANRANHLHFALLSDFTDSDTETHDSDAAIVAAASEGIRALNSRHSPERPDSFLLFHRPRRWNAQQGVWMGWERKRGKLAEFNQFLRGGARDSFSEVVGDVTSLSRVRYVITLDADTVLPPDSAAALVGAMAHPLNRAVYSEHRQRVVDGYGILQPRVSVSLESALQSRFAAVHSGHPGVDPYTTAVSDVYQDLYEEGSYTGKGIYDVDAFETATHGRFPENTLLSHDLIEGNFARAGLVTDIAVFDDYPAHYLTFSRRKHRWVRGDWQLLRWLFRWVPGPAGRERNRLGKLSRWKIFDNLRRSTVEISQLALILAGWTLLPGSPLRWTLLGLLAISAPWIVATLIALVGPSADKSLRAYYGAVARDAVTSVGQIALAIIFLPQQALLSADAIIRTLWRLAISKRNMLEWQSAALSVQPSAGSLGRLWRANWPAAVLPLMVAVVATVLMPGAEPASSPAGRWDSLLPIAILVPLWMLAPFVAHVMSSPHVREDVPLSEKSRVTALRYARAHWEYFARFADADSAWLAPDNYQEDPEPVVAMRTSPTNIGLQLLSIVSAHDLGFIGLEEATSRLERAFESLERMPKFRGHFYNWYDLPDLRVLSPNYVSTVDSGNLAGHLIALRQACLGFAESERIGSDPRSGGTSTLEARLAAIAVAADGLVRDMDFAFLYDESTKLFTIGFNADIHQHDHSSYDLLASEARLASFIAIAKDEVPPEHWFHLGRSLTWAYGSATLVSWSGSMFEYLMPILVMRAFPGTLLGHTYRGALERQIHYAGERGVPWGVSESAYNVRDRHLTYQYRAFGVPELALQRGLARDLVISPYATALALMVEPERAISNLVALEALGALGLYGFYDALDYTRHPADETFAMVRCHMSHHIGMTLVAITNALLESRWQERFHADSMVRAAALLLDERMPRRLELQKPQPTYAAPATTDDSEAGPAVREYGSADTKRPHVALLGHAPFTVMVTNAGSGYSRWDDFAVTRWRADGTRDDTGQFCYVRDLSSGKLWSSGHNPTGTIADSYRAYLATDRVTILRTDGPFETRTEIVVVPEDSAEVRRVTVTNNSGQVRELELTSYGEIVLASREADRVHPAFGNLFVETEWHEWCTAVTAKRRPRSADEPALWCAHVVDSGRARVGEVEYETDRSRFIGRGRSTRDPLALKTRTPLSGSTGAVLDPIFAIRTRVRLEPGQSESVVFTTLVAESRARLFALTDRYHGPHAAQRALDLAWTFSQIELRDLGLSATEAAACQDLAGYVLYPYSITRPSSEGVARGDGWQQKLWTYGISGDWPVVLASVGSSDGFPSLTALFTAHRYWRSRGVNVDLVVVVDEPQSYLQELRTRITELLLAAGGSTVLDANGGVHLVNRAALVNGDSETIVNVARLSIDCDGRSLERMVADIVRSGESLSPTESSDMAAARPAPNGTASTAPADAITAPLLFENGFGGLTETGAYRLRVRGDHVPPAPWANVIANRRAGFVVTERGGGFTWSGSSYFFRLTPWFNDPVSDPIGEAIYLRDEESGEFWSATPAPVRRDAPYVVTHAPGSTEFRHTHSTIETQLTLGIAAEDPVKISILRITNNGTRPRRLSLTSFVEWTLGVLPELTQHRVRTAFDHERGTIFADNPFDTQFAPWLAFSSVSERTTSHSGDRRSFIGRNGSPGDPAAMRRTDLDGRTGHGVDPCAAIRCSVDLAAGETRTIVILLGAAETAKEARRLVDTYRGVTAATSALEANVAAWDARLDVITVKTPDPAFDAIVNRWSLYQALACRMWARSALYQSGGAFGFRDQLQDVMALVYSEPGLAREHILLAAARQFPEGDVQHWWHPETGRGVRTRFSDDLVWLPYVVEHYVRVTGDRSVLDEAVPFLVMRSLEEHEHEAYDLPQVSEDSSSVYEHCLLALRRACTTGAHGLPLIGTGDWNDGMNRVGKDGRGESVWLGWFLTTTLRSFATLAEERSDSTATETLRTQADAYVRAIEAEGWDGAWYRRAYFDDGTPLGSASQTECRIDSLAQTWSAISGAGDPARQTMAMQALEEHLVDTDARLIRLLTPAFDKTPHDPGYIKGYVPGVRENGAQYTHAALWSVMAAARRGEGDRAYEWFNLLNPFTHTDTPEGVATYRVEPYVVAADVYTTPEALGRGGWTWYTGSASWMYRVGIEELIGLRKIGNTLSISPAVPVDWAEFSISYRFGGTTYAITVAEPGSIREKGADVVLDGRGVDGETITLVDDGAPHTVQIRPRQ